MNRLLVGNCFAGIFTVGVLWVCPTNAVEPDPDAHYTSHARVVQKMKVEGSERPDQSVVSATSPEILDGTPMEVTQNSGDKKQAPGKKRKKTSEASSNEPALKTQKNSPSGKSPTSVVTTPASVETTLLNDDSQTSASNTLSNSNTHKGKRNPLSISTSTHPLPMDTAEGNIPEKERKNQLPITTTSRLNNTDESHLVGGNAVVSMGVDDTQTEEKYTLFSLPNEIIDTILCYLPFSSPVHRTCKRIFRIANSHGLIKERIRIYLRRSHGKEKFIDTLPFFLDMTPYIGMKHMKPRFENLENLFSCIEQYQASPLSLKSATDLCSIGAKYLTVECNQLYVLCLKKLFERKVSLPLALHLLLLADELLEYDKEEYCPYEDVVEEFTSVYLEDDFLEPYAHFYDQCYSMTIEIGKYWGRWDFAPRVFVKIVKSKNFSPSYFQKVEGTLRKYFQIPCSCNLHFRSALSYGEYEDLGSYPNWNTDEHQLLLTCMEEDPKNLEVFVRQLKQLALQICRHQFSGGYDGDSISYFNYLKSDTPLNLSEPYEKGSSIYHEYTKLKDVPISLRARFIKCVPPLCCQEGLYGEDACTFLLQTPPEYWEWFANLATSVNMRWDWKVQYIQYNGNMLSVLPPRFIKLHEMLSTISFHQRGESFYLQVKELLSDLNLYSLINDYISENMSINGTIAELQRMLDAPVEEWIG